MEVLLPLVIPWDVAELELAQHCFTKCKKDQIVVEDHVRQADQILALDHILARRIHHEADLIHRDLDHILALDLIHVHVVFIRAKSTHAVVVIVARNVIATNMALVFILI